jgi:hypothetical protein
MKVLYETPEVELETRPLAEEIASGIRGAIGDRGENFEVRWTQEGLSHTEPRKYILTLVDPDKPNAQVQTLFLPEELHNPGRVNYRLSKAIAALFRTKVALSLREVPTGK